MDTVLADKKTVLSQKYLSKKSQLETSLAYQVDASIGLHKSTSNLFRHRQRVVPSVNLNGFNEFIGLNVSEAWADFEGMTTFDGG